MRWGALPIPAIRAGSRLGGRAWQVYAGIVASASFTTHQTVMGHDELMELTGIDRRSLNREIVAIEAAGLVRVKRRRTKSGQWLANMYTVLLFDDGVSANPPIPAAVGVPAELPLGVGESAATVSAKLPLGVGESAAHTESSTEGRAELNYTKGCASDDSIKTLFEAWLSEYPDKIERREAELAYRRAINRGASPEQLLEGLRRYIADEAAGHTLAETGKFPGPRALD